MTATAPHFRLLAGFQMLAGLAIIPFLVQSPGDSVLVGLTAIAWLVLAAANWLLADRLTAIAFDVSLYVSALVLAVHAASTPRPQMQVLDGMELLVLGMLAAFSMSVERVRAWLVFAGLTYIVGLAVNPLPIGLWLGPVIVIMVAGTTTVVMRLIHQVHDVSRHDPLTGALNRWGLADHSALLQAMSLRTGARLSVVFIDLNGFKIYNDTYGHLAGDRLLVTVVEELRARLRATDLVARIGGDEFVLVLAGVSGSQADTVMERVTPHLPIACTYGTVQWDAAEDLGTVIDEADRTMYERKQRLRSRRPCDDASGPR